MDVNYVVIDSLDGEKVVCDVVLDDVWYILLILVNLLFILLF